MSKAPLTQLDAFKRIINEDCCIGCGACAYLSPNSLKMQFDDYGMFKPEIVDAIPEDKLSTILHTCPFSDFGEHEDAIADRVLAPQRHHDEVGHYQALYAGYVNDPAIRDKGSSGAIGSWLLARLLDNGLVDGILHVAPSARPDENALFRYTISRDVDSVLHAGKSKYYPIEMSEVLKLITDNPGRYALVGVPCFIKAARRLAAVDPRINKAIVFYVGLVCGHLKSKAFAESFAWQSGIHPKALNGIEFRTKQAGKRASDYAVTMKSLATVVVKPTNELYGSNWGHGFFKYNACDFCDDVFAETADITIGDAWAPEFIKDSGGTSLIVVRNAVLGQLLNDANQSKEIHLESIDEALTARTQAAGLHHRREGLAYRLFLKGRSKQWAPAKRVTARADHLSLAERAMQRLRTRIKDASHKAWRLAVLRNDWTAFPKAMTHWLFLYRVLMRLRGPRPASRKAGVLSSSIGHKN